MKRFFKRLFISILLLLLLAVLAGGIWIRWRARAVFPVLDGAVPVSGLSARVEVLRDARGVPHIRAQSIEDALFAQGYVTAQDRLWQMDLSRRYAEGELSEVLGDSTLRFDIDSRTLGFPKLAAAALNELSPDDRRWLDSYVRGVNAFIETHRNRLPLEFLVLRYQPKPWREVDSVAVTLNLGKELSETWEVDLLRERISARLGKKLSADVFPDHSPLDVPVSDVSAAAHASPPKSALSLGNPLRSERGGPVSRGVGKGLVLQGLSGGLPSPFSPETAGIGSNNWVVSGAHTKSGKPLLANDPHLGFSIPSVWYMNHLKAPGLNVSGISIPGLPFVVIGHNEHIAWGMTNTGPDVQDLYAESFNFRDPKKYLHNGQWVDAEVRNETIKVRGQDDYHFAVKVTRHGPVVSHDSDRDLALQWTLLTPHAVRIPFPRINLARNWQEFTAALRDLAVPMLNCVYADDEGNIGFYAAGLVPLRKQGNGSVPVPGSTDDYDWTGFIPFADLPHAFNPPQGFIATANGRIVPDHYPYFVSARWEAPYRTARIFQLLRAGSAFTPQDMLRIQTDITSIEDQWLAKQIVAAAEKRPPSSADSKYALSVVKSWDGVARADSAATLALEVTKRALLTRILKPRLGDDLLGYRWPMSTTFLQNVLDQNLTRWLPPGDADFNETLMKSLEDGVRQIPALVHSPDHAEWKWGSTIPLIIRHPLSSHLQFARRWLDVGPYPQAGMGTTVKQTSQRIGPSMRMVVDFSALDDSLQNIVVGESGQPFSPYYRDQFPAWYAGQSFPMLFSDEAVEKGAVHRLVLEPQP
jgi:penicillin G amidase